MTTRQVLHRTDVLALTARIGAGNAKPIDPGTAKLVSAAKEFEAMMLSQLMKPLKFGAGVDDGGEESSGGAADTVRGLATESLAKALAASGGVGIADKIVSQVMAEHQQQSAKKMHRGTKVA